jgi:hypothetical protein
MVIFNLSKNRNIFFTIIITFGAFLFSLIISNYYVDGDQIYYSEAYDSLKGYNMFEGLLIYRSKILSDEPIHFILIWIFSNLGIDKNIIMSLVNAVLTFILIRILLRWNVVNFIIITLLTTNFYLYVLFFSAERLKFSILFILLSVFFIDKKKTSIFFALLSVITHTQTALIFVANFFGQTMSKLVRLNRLNWNRFNYGKFLTLIFFLTIFLFLKDHLYSKFFIYSDMSQSKSIITNVWQSLVFLFLSLFYSKKWFETFSMFIIMILAASLVGSDRITILSYFLFMHHALKINRGINFGVLLSIFYLGFKSILFFTNVFNNGHGF